MWASSSQRIRFDITINPVKLSGGIGVGAGPRLFGTEAVSVDGNFTYENANPNRHVINGSARIVDIPLASGSVSYQTDGRFDMSAQAAFSKLGVGFDGLLQGWVDGANAFNFQGAAGVHVGRFASGGDAVVSSSGVAACRHWRGPDVRRQVGRPFDPPGRASDVRQLRDRSRPAGGRLQRRGHARAAAGGLYRLSLKPGSAPASVVRSAQSLAAPRVRARVVLGQGRRRALRWTFTAVRGRSVVFYEQGRDTRRRLTATTHDRGRLTFTAPDGRAGRREIIALVRHDGLTQSAGVVARYTAPRPRRPGRQGSLRITSRRGVLSVRWGRAGGAASYEVRVVLSDGRRLLFLPTRTARRVTSATSRRARAHRSACAVSRRPVAAGQPRAPVSWSGGANVRWDGAAGARRASCR